VIENTPRGNLLSYGTKDELRTPEDTCVLYYHHGLHPTIATYEREDERIYVLLGKGKPKQNDDVNECPGHDPYFFQGFPYVYEPYEKERGARPPFVGSIRKPRPEIAFIESIRKYNIEFPDGKCNHAHQLSYLATEKGRTDMLKENDFNIRLDIDCSKKFIGDKYLGDQEVTLLSLG
jgi:hypothetical protein